MTDTMEQSGSSYGYLIKTIIVGESSVGKSSILKRFTQNVFNQYYSPTIGLEFESKEIVMDNNSMNGDPLKITLQIWDTAGQESFHSIVKSFYRNSAAVLLVYDVTRRETFNKLEYWINQIKQNSHDDVIIVLIGNKQDSSNQSQSVISEEEVTALVSQERLSMHFYTSALEDIQISESFNYVAEEVYKRFIKDQSELKNGIRTTSSQSISADQFKIMAKQVESQEPTEEQKRLSIKNQQKPSNQNSTVQPRQSSTIQSQQLSQQSSQQQQQQQQQKKKKCC